MNKRSKLILSAFLAILLISVAGAYIYVSNYYHTDETTLAVMAYQTTIQVQIDQDGDVIWFVPKDPTAGLIFIPAARWSTPLTYRCCASVRNGESWAAL